MSWVLLAGCSQEAANVERQSDEIHASAAIVEVAPVVAPTPDVMEKWGRSCVLCHVDGNGGAPRLGHADEWSDRINQGEEIMVTHAIEGLNQMPPLGYCMDCERADFVALTRYMAALR